MSRFPVHVPALAPLPARPRRALVAALLLPLLLPLGACSADSARTCLPDGGAVSSADLVGAYTGLRDAEGVSVGLEADAERPGASGGRVTVENWPTGDWYRSELGETFDGAGTWEFRPGGEAGEKATVSFVFTEPRKFGANDTLDTLTVAADSDRIVLHENDDPDICPRFRLESSAS
ncbi:hypothetical protein [Streptomyces sp. SID14515]|uniref:hypothetical protein n=1 Tax=Streptomyces sp. SID14515 TaxID=2706074 RepID=UPI0013C6D4FE|nr:hypothetical protein [Streptomyces sp. SID14515]NEB37477.1 hypothetical protein [Streptomyces sp. SID14515]